MLLMLCILKKKKYILIFIAWIVFIHLEQNTNFNLIKSKDLCGALMPSGDTKILESHQCQNLYKIPYD